MGELKDWARRQSKFVKLDDGESEIFKYIGYKFVPKQDDPSKEVMMFELEDMTGTRKFWNTSAAGVANQMDTVPKGSQIEITRSGLEKATKYLIRKV